jgi:hypothetical protein
MGLLVMHQLNFGKIRIEEESLEDIDAEKRATQKRWEAYIAAMRGYLSSHPMDINKVDAHIARMRAEERVWRDRDERKMRRRAWLLALILSRYAPTSGA